MAPSYGFKDVIKRASTKAAEEQHELTKKYVLQYLVMKGIISKGDVIYDAISFINSKGVIDTDEY